MSNFKAFAHQVTSRFNRMSKNELYVADISGDDLWQLYLSSFPAGTNPIFRVRTEHDGSYDRNFIRQLGNVVSIEPNGSVSCLWDLAGLEEPYATVVKAMSEAVLSKPVTKVFRTKEKTYGYLSTHERLENGSVYTWYHFNAEIATRHHTRDVGTVVGSFDAMYQVIMRGLKELTMEAVETVLDLIESNGLYRGAEFKQQLVEFRSEKAKFDKLTTDLQRSVFVWNASGNARLRVRNTAIGTLLIDLSEGVDLEKAVKSFESKVAPTNYKRPTAIITKRQVEDAMKTLKDLDLESALERRFAKISDVKVNNVLWVAADSANLLKDGIAQMLLKEAIEVAPSKLADKAVDISIDDFMSKVVPQSSEVELMFSGRHQGNLVSLTAPVASDVNPLFKWDNNFAWSYNGDITDSITERVKAAGGNVDAPLRVSLSWYNTDDLDLHCVCPKFGHVYFGDKKGILDVDMNAFGGLTNEPVENLSWKTVLDGIYQVNVHQFRKRSTQNGGFCLQVTNAGQVSYYHYQGDVRDGQTVSSLEIHVKNGVISKIHTCSTGFEVSSHAQPGKEIWGIQTEKFIKVKTILNSPNHWDGNNVGNKHWFFILEGCKNDAPTRGLYNEFLKTDLEKHRRVFEVLGNKTKCPVTEEQLSGLGFSSTKKDVVMAKVSGKTGVRMYNIQF